MKGRLQFLTGDATSPIGKGPRVIAHVCNDVGGWGRGFVVALSKKWAEPEAAYRKWAAEGGETFVLGQACLVNVEENLWVANMIGQRDHQTVNGVPPVRYEAIRKCLQQVREHCVTHNASVHMPRIGCGLAGGRWQEIEEIIAQACSRSISKLLSTICPKRETPSHGRRDMQEQATQSLYKGRFLELVSINTWEFVRRHHATGIVAILPVHDDGRYVFIEQYRTAVNAPVIDWPAGLVGDEGDVESHLDAARRELLEETGYDAAAWHPLGETLSSPGLTDETVEFFSAKGLKQAGPGGGVGGENITRHEITPADLPAWINSMKQAGKRIDVKVYAGLAMLNLAIA